VEPPRQPYQRHNRRELMQDQERHDIRHRRAAQARGIRAQEARQPVQQPVEPGGRARLGGLEARVRWPERMRWPERVRAQRRPEKRAAEHHILLSRACSRRMVDLAEGNGEGSWRREVKVEVRFAREAFQGIREADPTRLENHLVLSASFKDPFKYLGEAIERAICIGESSPSHFLKQLSYIPRSSFFTISPAARLLAISPTTQH
jgi:hypothetical protein